MAVVTVVLPGESQGTAKAEQFLEGVLVSRARGKTFTSLILVALDGNNDTNSSDDPQSKDDHDTSFFLVRLRFTEADKAADLRSFCKQHYKIGDKLKILLPDDRRENETNPPNNSDEKTALTKIQRMAIDCPTQESAKNRVEMLVSRFWNAKRCQQFQDRWKAVGSSSSGSPHLPPSSCQSPRTSSHLKRKRTTTQKQKQKQTVTTNNETDNNNGHGSGRAKREQAERLANFLVNMIALKLWREENDSGQEQQQQNPEDLLVSMPPLEAYRWRAKAIRYLNTGGGVCDVAGGSGHVSMVRQ